MPTKRPRIIESEDESEGNLSFVVNDSAPLEYISDADEDDKELDEIMRMENADLLLDKSMQHRFKMMVLFDEPIEKSDFFMDLLETRLNPALTRGHNMTKDELGRIIAFVMNPTIKEKTFVEKDFGKCSLCRMDRSLSHIFYTNDNPPLIVGCCCALRIKSCTELLTQLEQLKIDVNEKINQGFDEFVDNTDNTVTHKCNKCK